MSARAFLSYRLFHSGHSLITGIYLTLSNVLFTLALVLTLVLFGQHLKQVDALDIFFEFSSVLIALVMFVAIGVTKIPRGIKAPFLAGLFFMQQGRTVDGLDEFIFFDITHWSAIGDGVAMLGELLIVYAATRWIAHTYRLSMTDKLTHLYNRHYVDKAFEKSKHYSRRNNDGVHLIMLDVDDFKHINDRFGHAVGDDVLKNIANVLRQNTRASDVIARQGGEEFEVLLTEGNRDTAMNIADRIRASISTQQAAHIPPCTASLGVAAYVLGDDAISLRRRADFAVYQAKSEGKNKVVFAEYDIESRDILETISAGNPIHEKKSKDLS